MMVLIRKWMWLFGGLIGGFSGLSGQVTTDLLLSEYVEGTSFNKAIEVYNGTGGVIELSGYTVELYRGGTIDWDRQAELSDFQTELENGETLVLRNSQSTTIGFSSSVVGFTGDDAITLSKNGLIIDLIGVIGADENRLPNTTRRRLATVLSPSSIFIESEWEIHEVDTFDGLGMHAVKNPDREPSEHVTDLKVMQTGLTACRIEWVDAGGANLPYGYLVWIVEGDIVLPEDGTMIPEDPDLSDGEAVYDVGYEIESLTVDGLKSDRLYRILIVPYANRDELIDYKVEGVLESAMITLRSERFLLAEHFNSLNDWQIVTRSGEREWEWIEGTVQANAFGSKAPADDWLISPLLDFDAIENAAMRFEVLKEFNDIDFDPALSILVSTDYSGIATMIDQADWDLIDVPLFWVDEGERITTPDISLRDYGGSGYIAFRYESSGTGLNHSEGWMIDECDVFSSTNTAPLIELSVDPEQVIETAGAEAIVGTVRLSEAVEGVVEVYLDNGNDALLSMPETLTFLSGESEAFFLIDLLPGLNLSATERVEIRARSNRYIGGSSMVQIVPAEQRFLRAEMTLASVDEDAAEGTVQLWVTLSRAPDVYPYEVMLSSGDRSELEVPLVLRFESEDGLSKGIDLMPVADGVFDPDVEVVVTVTSDDYGSEFSQITVRNVDAPPKLYLDLSSSLVFENEGWIEGTVTLSADPIQGYPVEVLIEVSDSSEVGPLSEPLMMGLEDGRVATFVLPIVWDEETDGNQRVEIKASVSNFISDTETVEVWDVDLNSGPDIIALHLEPSAVGEGASAVGSLFLSRSLDVDLEVTLISGNPQRLYVPERIVVSEGHSFIQFPVTAWDDDIINEDETVTVFATVANWIRGEASIKIFNDDRERILWLEVEEAVLLEGTSTLARLSMNRPEAEDLWFEIEGTADLSVPEGILIPAGEVISSFMVEAVNGDGWEGIEDAKIYVYGAGHPGVEVSVRILESEARVNWKKPLSHDSFAAEQTLSMEVAINGDQSTVERVVFMVDGIEVGSVFAAPFILNYMIPWDRSRGTEMTLQADVIEVNGTHYASDPIVVFVQFNPVLNDGDFIRQIYEDTTGQVISESRYEAYWDLFETSQSRYVISEALFAEEAVDWLEAGMALFYLLNDTIPDTDAFYAEGMAVGDLLSDPFKNKGIPLPPVIEYLQFGETPLFEVGEVEGSESLIGGLLGLTQVMLEYGRNRIAIFGGEVTTLSHQEWFERLWWRFHGVLPTAQQILQAHTRIEVFMTEQDVPFDSVDRLLYGRSRLIVSLIREETFLFGTDVISNRPNVLWKDRVYTALLLLMGWNEAAQAERKAARELLVGLRSEQQFEQIFSHPRYWERFGYSWLGSRQSEGTPYWRASDWFGWFGYTVDDWPWVYHWDHGWIYAGRDNHAEMQKGFWYHDGNWGWVWTRGTDYPWIYAANVSGWIFYQQGTRNPRWFYLPLEKSWQAFE